ncbi:MAG: hypothetical protein ACKOOG_10020 [Actinomycetota bacterium]
MIRYQPVLRLAILAAPVAIILFLGWQRRWACDDAFINYRIVRQILAGNGPVFNDGIRVEAGTSPAWLGILATLDVLTPIRLEWIAALTSVLATATGVALAIAGTLRLSRLGRSATGIALPVGALTYVALPPAWDYATSGLENGLGILWLGASWWALTRRFLSDLAEPPPPTRPRWTLVLLGLGPLVRPDLALFTFAFLMAYLLLTKATSGWLDRLSVLAIALAVPGLTQVARMAYFGEIVPNTALAKEGSLSNWEQGRLYLSDFVGPHLLWIPLATLVIVVVVSSKRRAVSRPVAGIISAAVMLAGLAQCLYIVRVGGDYMHGRMLLPSLFGFLLPVMVVPVNRTNLVAALVIGVWAVLSFSTLRPSYSQSTDAWPGAAIDQVTGISDERLVYARISGKGNPVTLGDFADGVSIWVRAGDTTRSVLEAGVRGFLPNGESQPVEAAAVVQPISGGENRLVTNVGALGMLGYAAGIDITVVDRFGIADDVTAHHRLVRRGRPGHEKELPAAWSFARFADPSVPPPSGTTSEEIAAARQALTCGALAELIDAGREPLTPVRAFRNLIGSFGRSTFRFSPDPFSAEVELCT